MSAGKLKCGHEAAEVDPRGTGWCNVCELEHEHATQVIGESLYWWAVERTTNPGYEIEIANTDGAGRNVTAAARQYARELLAEGLR